MNHSNKYHFFHQRLITVTVIFSPKNPQIAMTHSNCEVSVGLRTPGFWNNWKRGGWGYLCQLCLFITNFPPTFARKTFILVHNKFLEFNV